MRPEFQLVSVANQNLAVLFGGAVFRVEAQESRVSFAAAHLLAQFLLW